MMLTVRNLGLVAGLMMVTSVHAETMQSQLDALTQIEELRTEVQTLRGELEVTQHELDQLRQQQRDFYDDLNQRISTISKTGNAAAPAVANTTVAVDTIGTKPAASVAPEPNIQTAAAIDTSAAEAAIKNANGDLAAYQIAYGFLQSKKYPEAITAFNTYLSTYPKGEYVANVNYWLGEIYLIQHQYPQAEKEFSTVVNQYPSHQKAADALLKLGYVYEALGDKQKAFATFQDVQKKYPNTAVAQLAQTKASQLN